MALGPTRAHINWLIDSRHKNQTETARLHGLLRRYKGHFHGSRSRKAHILVAVAFSLWRAAFLAEKAEDKDATSLGHAETFLQTLLVDNAINYQQDRKARKWTYRFYMDASRSQLEKLGTFWPDALSILNNRAAGKKQRSTDRWNRRHDAFVRGVDLLEGELRTAAQSKLAKSRRAILRRIAG